MFAGVQNTATQNNTNCNLAIACSLCGRCRTQHSFADNLGKNQIKVVIKILTESQIKSFIDNDFNSDRKRFAREGHAYYWGKHDILQYRMFYFNAESQLVEDKMRANNRICHPFFTELVDQLAAYMLSFDESPIRAKNNEHGLQDHLDEYFDDEFWAEIHDLITGTNAKGFEYLYAYKGKDDKLAFQCADSLGVVEVRANETDDACEYVIYHYIDRIDKDKKCIKRIQVHTANEIHFYKQVDDGAIEFERTLPNVVWTDPKTGEKYGKGLGFLPFWRLDNNKMQISGLRPIKGLIDDYDLMACGLSNNLQDFDTPLHVVKGFPGDNLDELQINLKTKKVVGVDDNGGVEVKTIDVPYQARKEKLEIDEKNIYRFGMGFNSSQTGDGNVTNVVIRSRYTLLDLKSDKLEKRLKRFLKPIIKVVLDEINAKEETDFQISDVHIEFEHQIPTNDSENAQNDYVRAQAEQLRINSLLQAATVLGDEEVLKGICDILELDFEELKGQLDERKEVNNLLTAQDELQGVVTDEN